MLANEGRIDNMVLLSEDVIQLLSKPAVIGYDTILLDESIYSMGMKMYRRFEGTGKVNEFLISFSGQCYLCATFLSVVFRFMELRACFLFRRDSYLATLVSEVRWVRLTRRHGWGGVMSPTSLRCPVMETIRCIPH